MNAVTDNRALDPSIPPPRENRRPTIRSDLRRLSEYRSLIWYLIDSSLRTENTGTVFGFFWWILDPVFLMLVYWFLFGVIFHSTVPYFPLFVLISLVSWEFFQKSIDFSIVLTLERARSMQQVDFPRSAIPISLNLAELGHFVCGMALAAILAITIYGLHPTWGYLLILPTGLIQLLFGLGLAFVLSATNFFFRDVSHLLRYVFRLWYLISPGLYTISTRIPPRWQSIYTLNPFANFFPIYHSALLHEPLPSTLHLVYVAVLSVSVLVSGYWFYIRVSPQFVKLGS